MTADPTLEDFWGAFIEKLRVAPGDRDAAWRVPTLASVGPDGAPQARKVVLRRVDVDAGVLEVHTDRRSAKWAALTETPRTALVFWDAQDQRQLRVDGLASLHADDATAQTALSSLPTRGAAIYGARPAPGTPIAAADAHDQNGVASATFGLIRVSITRVDALHFGPSGHRRATWRVASGARAEGGWIAP